MGAVIPLFDFAYHGDGWLEDIKKAAKEEPWGEKNKVLELYLRANYEIAKEQGKVYESEDTAYWKPGYLVSPSSDPITLKYKKNAPGRKNKWRFEGVISGRFAINDEKFQSSDDLQVKYDPPEFESKWDIFIDQKNFEHIMGQNAVRLEQVFGKEVSKNRQLLFKAIYGEIILEKKDSTTIIPQWYNGEYQFLMPLYLNSPDKVDLTATLTRDTTMRRYQVNTLLLPSYAYAYARSVVKSRAGFGAWIALPPEELNVSEGDDTE